MASFASSATKGGARKHAWTKRKKSVLTQAAWTNYGHMLYVNTVPYLQFDFSIC